MGTVSPKKPLSGKAVVKDPAIVWRASSVILKMELLIQVLLKGGVNGVVEGVQCNIIRCDGTLDLCCAPIYLVKETPAPISLEHCCGA